MGFTTLLSTLAFVFNLAWATNQNVELSAEAQRSRSSKTISIMTYNVENLFDAEHDPGKDDYQYLPKNHPEKQSGCESLGRSKASCLSFDWTQEKLEFKLNQIKKVVDASGPLPDVLVVEEIENENVLRMLAKKLGFTGWVIQEGFNTRGIDVGLLYHENQLTYKSHAGRYRQSARSNKPTGRAILATYFEIKSQYNKTLVVYGNHWPARMAPAYSRFEAAKVLKQFVDEDTIRYGKDRLYIVALGDFNSTNDDWPAPFRGLLLDKDNWENSLLDVRLLALYKRNYDANAYTYFYPGKMEWQYLDRILVSKNLYDHKGPEVLTNTYKVVRNEFNSHVYEYTQKSGTYYGSRIVGVPKRFDPRKTDAEAAGISDHFPVKVSLNFAD